MDCVKQRQTWWQIKIKIYENITWRHENPGIIGL